MAPDDKRPDEKRGSTKRLSELFGSLWKAWGGGSEDGDASRRRQDPPYGEDSGFPKGDDVKILRRGPAMRVIFFYPGEEGTYVDNAEVTLYENGLVHINSSQEESTTHLQNCEILWRFETEADDRTSKVRLLKPKSESRAHEPSEDPEPTPPGKDPGKPPKAASLPSPDLR
jgi:hypothetical protein